MGGDAHEARAKRAWCHLVPPSAAVPHATESRSLHTLCRLQVCKPGFRLNTTLKKCQAVSAAPRQGRGVAPARESRTATEWVPPHLPPHRPLTPATRAHCSATPLAPLRTPRAACPPPARPASTWRGSSAWPATQRAPPPTPLVRRRPAALPDSGHLAGCTRAPPAWLQAPAPPAADRLTCHLPPPPPPAHLQAAQCPPASWAGSSTPPPCPATPARSPAAPPTPPASAPAPRAPPPALRWSRSTASACAPLVPSWPAPTPALR